MHPLQAMTTAVNAVVQIEPFKLFHNINQGVSTYNEQSPPIATSHQLATVNSLPGRSNKPAGMAQVSTVFQPTVDVRFVKLTSIGSSFKFSDGICMLLAQWWGFKRKTF